MKKHDRKKEKKLASEEQDIQNVERFKNAKSSDEKVKILSEISRDKYKLQALESIQNEFDLYKYIGKISEVSSILELLSKMKNEQFKKNVFDFLTQQLRGNALKYIQLLAGIDFKVNVASNMHVLRLNNLNGLNVDILNRAFQNVMNPQVLKFSINAGQSWVDKKIKYTFEEMIVIMSKIEELIKGIKETDSERDKFEIIYKRITSTITYDHSNLELEDMIENNFKQNRISWGRYVEKKIRLRHDIAGLYGGLVNNKSVCAGYALIFHEAAQYVRT